mgnify:FL=1
MGEKTNISWCEHTINWWIGCTKISPACDGCYAEAMMDKRYGRVQWGNHPRVRTSKSTWDAPLKWNRKAETAGTRPFVFSSSLSDIFDNQVPSEWRADAFKVMRETPNLIYLLLTKRPQLIIQLSEEAGGLPQNAAIGATMASQPEYDRDRMRLAEAKAALNPVFSFVSIEPILSRIILDKNAPDWIIVGGETDQGSHKARDADIEWLRYLRDQSRELGRAFFMKQMTRKAPIPVDLLVREWPIERRAAA